MCFSPNLDTPDFWYSYFAMLKNIPPMPERDSSTSRTAIQVFQQLALIAASSLFLIGCATSKPKALIARDVRVNVSISSKDVLYSQVVSESGMQGVAKRIGKMTIKALDSRGIKNSGVSTTISPDEARLVVELDTIENETKHKPGPFFTTIVYQHCKIRYTARLISPDGVKLFEFEGREHDESLDSLTQIIGRYIGKRVAKCYASPP